LISAVRDHWLCIDLEGSFSRSNLKGFERITPDEAKPTILSNGDYPFTVNRDGNIYSALWKPGRLEINRQSPDGKVSAVQLDGATNPAIGGITGMASGPDGSLFVTDGSMLLKVTMPDEFLRWCRKLWSVIVWMICQHHTFAAFPPVLICGGWRSILKEPFTPPQTDAAQF
jgi:hypothetical protein